MARGWESKSVEDQQAQASAEKAPTKPRLTAAQAAQKRLVDGLLLARRNVLQQLAAARDSRHRSMLETALAELDRKLHDLD